MASDSDGDEDFVSFGTPLEPLEEDEPTKKPVPLHEQTVKDEKGRYQRFHGAFTGGFSAGYFNSVGSKEGWSPSTFVSSRQQKVEKQHVRPEDFMDEEDFSEHGIAPAQITTSQEFSSSHRDKAREKARAVNAQAALIPGDTLLEELIAPARLSIGVELLRKMGWKEGQGVGPRVKRKARRQQTGEARPYGCVLPPAGSEDSEDDDDDDFAPENVTFAPKDVTPVDFTPRLGVQGLGRGVDCSEAHSKAPAEGGVAGQAFGVGALEDDDEDVYQRDSMSRYDTELGGEEPGDGLYGWTAPQQYTKKRDKNKDASYLGKILEGFTLAQKTVEDKTIFAPPTLPRDYRPVHRFHPSIPIARLSGVSPALAEALRTSRGHMVKEEPQEGGRHKMDSSHRGALLGEDALQGPSSVMELLRPEDRQRLLNLRNSSTTPSANAPASSSHRTSSSGGSLPGSLTGSLTAQSSAATCPPALQQQQEALASWRGVQSSAQTFRPFDNNPSKQARYELYLNSLRQGDKDALEQSVDSGMTEWERSREKEEFVRSSILYRPTSSSLSSRFTRAKDKESEDNTVEVSRDQESDVDDKQAAVKMKMFGKLTRETFEWHPDKLLCKRFNVPDPYPGSSMLGLPKVKRDKFSVFNFLTVTESRETAPPKSPETKKKSRWDDSKQKKKVKEEEEDEPRTQPALPEDTTEPEDQQSSDKKKKDGEEEEEEEEEEESRPPMDLFKAIFAGSSDEKSSSSEAEEEEEEEDTKEEEGKISTQPQNLFNISNVKTSITASSTSVTSATTSTSQTVKAVVLSQSSSQEEFGPKLPPRSAALIRGGATSIRSPREEEKPRRTSKEKKHKNKKPHKDKKKKKHKKHKHKAKQKKSKKEESDSSEEDKDQEGDGQVSTEELLKRLKSVQSHQTR
ncbi:unnamed protein product [Pleuronectes platessa]|uniref:G-patch domain-containing protein n=1 Tax=Pleuronectes platessa TaxID=8262 RepID=A0A9N7Z4Q9_PLEPL|nr:unnamed protein product [Pleuronectes platessa]